MPTGYGDGTVKGDWFELNWSITGGGATRMRALLDGYNGRNSLPPPAVRQEIRETDAQFVPTLLAPNGTSANFLDWGNELPQCQPVRASLKATIPAHGRWVIRFGPPEQAAERVVDI